jgi:hypothetical protein
MSLRLRLISLVVIVLAVSLFFGGAIACALPVDAVAHLRRPNAGETNGSFPPS